MYIIRFTIKKKKLEIYTEYIQGLRMNLRMNIYKKKRNIYFKKKIRNG